MAIPSLIQTVLPSGKANLVILLTVLKLSLITILLQEKPNGEFKLVLWCFSLMVWMDKDPNILQQEWRDSYRCAMMI